MAEPLYRKYGNELKDPGAALFQGQAAVNSSFKEALSGVGNLLKQVEQGYIDDNTTKVQEYLKNNIRSAGIGADAPTTEDIKSQFGKLINTEAIDKVVTSTRDKMLGEARDEASMAAGKIFGETEDIAKAGEAFKQKFLALGGRESQAADEMGKWRLDNAYRAEDVKVANAELISKFKSGVAADIIANKGTNPDEVLNYSLDMLPEKLRTQAKLETRKEVEALSAMSSEQIDGRNYIGTLWDAQIQSKEAEINQTLALGKAELDKVARIPQSARDAVSKLNSTLGGMGDAVKNDATGKWFASSLFNKNNKEEEGASRALQEGIDGLLEYGDISIEDAQAIGFLAYQDARAESGVGIGGGVSIQADVLQKHFNKYAQQYPAAKQAEANYAAIQNAAIKERARLQAEKAKTIYDFDTEAKHANISGSRFDTQEYISRLSNGGSTVPATANTPTTTEPKPEAIPTKANPTIADVLNKVTTNANIPAETPGPITTVPPKNNKARTIGSILAATASPNEANASLPPALSSEKLALDRGIIDGVDLKAGGKSGKPYATNPDHIGNVFKIYKSLPTIKTDVDVSSYIDSKFPGSPITGLMVTSAAKKFGVPVKLMIAAMQQDSGLGTTGLGAKSRNPGNVGNDDSGKMVTYPTWGAGVDALARELANRKVKGAK